MEFDCLMMDKTLAPCLARFFSWHDLSRLCSNLLSISFQFPVNASAVPRSWDNTWKLELEYVPLSSYELDTLAAVLEEDDYDGAVGRGTENHVWVIPYLLSHKLVARVLPFHVKGSHITPDGVWFTGGVCQEISGSVYAVTVIRVRYESCNTEAYTSNYLVDMQRLPDSSPKACADLLRGITSDFLKTKEGQEAYKETCKDFNWGDMETYISDSFFVPYGVTRCSGFMYPCCNAIDVLANQDELLGGDIFEGQVLSEALSAAT